MNTSTFESTSVNMGVQMRTSTSTMSMASDKYKGVQAAGLKVRGSPRAASQAARGNKQEVRGMKSEAHLAPHLKQQEVTSKK